MYSSGLWDDTGNEATGVKRAVIELEATAINNFTQVLTPDGDPSSGLVRVTLNNVTDGAQNTTNQETFSFWYDIIPPVPANFDYDDLTNDLNPQITINAPDVISSGTDKITVSLSTNPVVPELTQWRKSDGNWVAVGDNLLINGTGNTDILLGGSNAGDAMITDSDPNLDVTLILTFTDEAENSEEFILDQFTIDRAPPSITGFVAAAINPAEFYNGAENVDVLINLSEAISDDTFLKDEDDVDLTNATEEGLITSRY
jgi:hypothetical protein